MLAAFKVGKCIQRHEHVVRNRFHRNNLEIGLHDKASLVVGQGHCILQAEQPCARFVQAICLDGRIWFCAAQVYQPQPKERTGDDMVDDGALDDIPTGGFIANVFVGNAKQVRTLIVRCIFDGTVGIEIASPLTRKEKLVGGEMDIIAEGIKRNPAARALRLYFFQNEFSRGNELGRGGFAIV